MAGSKVADSSPFLHLGRANSLYNRRESCVICVGSTGSGKSSNIAIFTGNPVNIVIWLPGIVNTIGYMVTQ